MYNPKRLGRGGALPRPVSNPTATRAAALAAAAAAAIVAPCAAAWAAEPEMATAASRMRPAAATATPVAFAAEDLTDPDGVTVEQKDIEGEIVVGVRDRSRRGLPVVKVSLKTVRAAATGDAAEAVVYRMEGLEDKTAAQARDLLTNPKYYNSYFRVYARPAPGGGNSFVAARPSAPFSPAPAGGALTRLVIRKVEVDADVKTAYLFVDPADIQEREAYVGLVVNRRKGEETPKGIVLVHNKAITVPDVLSEGKLEYSIATAKVNLLPPTGSGGVSGPTAAPGLPAIPFLTPPDRQSFTNVVVRLSDKDKTDVGQLTFDLQQSEIPFLSGRGFRGDIVFSGLISTEDRDPNSLLKLAYVTNVGLSPVGRDAFGGTYLNRERGWSWAAEWLRYTTTQRAFSSPKDRRWELAVSPARLRLQDRAERGNLKLGEFTFTASLLDYVIDRFSRAVDPITAGSSDGITVHIRPQGVQGPRQQYDLKWKTPIAFSVNTGKKRTRFALDFEYRGQFLYFLQDRNDVVRKAFRDGRIPFDTPRLPNYTYFNEFALTLPVSIAAGEFGKQKVRLGVRDGFTDGQSRYDPFATDIDWQVFVEIGK